MLLFCAVVADNNAVVVDVVYSYTTVVLSATRSASVPRAQIATPSTRPSTPRWLSASEA